MAQLTWNSGSPELKLSRSSFNLSNKTLFDVEQNWLVPTAVYDVIPGDKFILGSSCLIRTTPLIKPAFTIDLKAKTISCYVAYRTIWKPFEEFFTGGRTGNANIPLPIFDFCHKTTNNGKPYNILDYFDLPSRSSNSGEYGGNDHTALNALYLLAYLKIWNDYFRNPSIDIEIDVFNLTIYLPNSDTAYKFNPNKVTTFIWNGTSYSHINVTNFLYWCFSLISLTAKPNDLTTATLTDGYVSSFPSSGTDDGFRLMPAIVNLPRDLFTSALPTASGPNEVSLGISGSFSSNLFTPNTDIAIGGIGLNEGLTPGLGIRTTNTNGTKLVQLQALTKGSLVADNVPHLSGSPSTSGSILGTLSVSTDSLNKKLASSNLSISGIYPRELRLVFGLDLKNQIRNLTGNRYNDLSQAFYGVSIPDYRVQRAEYIGGTQYPIYTSEVLQTSESQNTPLGEQGGHNIASGVGNHGKYFVRELGCILNLFWINSNPPYTQSLRRDWRKYSLNDFFFPMFEKLGDQEIHQSELSFYFNSNTTHYNTRIFGFAPRYSEYKFYNHTAKGGFRGNYRYWSQARFFDQRPAETPTYPTLSPQFLKPDVQSFNRIFQTISNNYTLKPYLVKFENRTIAYRPLQENTLGYLIDHF